MFRIREFNHQKENKMARVTVEDCITKVNNRFNLVLLASQRARAIGTGAALTVDRDNDKNSVVSLREIAEETISLDDLKENLIRSHQKVIEIEEDEDEIIDFMDGEEEWTALSDEDRMADVLAEEAGMQTTDAETEDAALEDTSEAEAEKPE